MGDRIQVQNIWKSLPGAIITQVLLVNSNYVEPIIGLILVIPAYILFILCFLLVSLFNRKIGLAVGRFFI